MPFHYVLFVLCGKILMTSTSVEYREKIRKLNSNAKKYFHMIDV